jgi:hypothetical protein
MIIKGKSRAGPGSLAAHLGNAEKNERVSLIETRGTVAQDLRGALVEMDAVAAGTRCEKPLYHAAISPEQPHRLTPEQRIDAIDALEKKMGLEGHARVVVLHEKLGREHLHIVWSRIDLEKMRSVSDSHNYRRHEEVARDLERRFGHTRVQGAHAEREGVRRPNRTPSRAELRQEERTGIKDRDVRAEVTEAYRSSDGALAFKAALEERGYILAQGDRRDFVVVDSAGGIHSLARRIEDVRAAELRAYMTPIERASLPTADHAKEAQLARLAERDSEERRRLREAEEDHRSNRVEASYAKGGDYVSQSLTATRDARRRQRELDKLARRDDAWDRIESGETERARRLREGGSSSSKDENRPASKSGADDAPANVEMTDAMRQRLARLRAHKSELGASSGRDGTARDGPRPQGEAPGGGRTRSR